MVLCSLCSFTYALHSQTIRFESEEVYQSNVVLLDLLRYDGT